MEDNYIRREGQKYLLSSTIEHLKHIEFEVFSPEIEALSSPFIDSLALHGA